jgi:hypothetical protein
MSTVVEIPLDASDQPYCTGLERSFALKQNIIARAMNENDFQHTVVTRQKRSTCPISDRFLPHSDFLSN